MSDKPPSLPFVIRAARISDIEQITELLNLPGFRHGTLRLPYQTVETTRKRFEAANPRTVSLVAELDGRIVGDAGLMPYEGRRSHAASVGMGVHDDFCGRGIGSALLSALLETADNWLNLRRVELTVFTDNEPAIRLYERLGFVKEGQFADFAFRDGRYVDAYSMARIRR
ncbi:GNAT family N-acetyltransferase [Rhizobium sp. LC145]|jgi:L-phenylalanine/L-methionine N-acetyltransferase|uniref:GNAT family N-acetyltransferase n=1 Tax=Rhizobium sp. LC145 TaxID=1120688 RepID=UPI00062A3D26|nr:GNAT family N-acetyltransferase [Rhizobium sp. LC145]KKX29249.1 GNAT family acetyltransferase [Rhizobium sp. LC145]TKT68849.1 GNAT family N-acetyltransferase [Rhizobiaceae bacterium LC148]